MCPFCAKCIYQKKQSLNHNLPPNYDKISLFLKKKCILNVLNIREPGTLFPQQHFLTIPKLIISLYGKRAYHMQSARHQCLHILV